MSHLWLWHNLSSIESLTPLPFLPWLPHQFHHSYNLITILVPFTKQQPPQWMSKSSKSDREGFDDDSSSSLLKSTIFTSCFYFRIIIYLANFTRAVPL